ncbi:MAG: IscS subfamily cysteine desulfurase [Pseudohongiellaceae bacterium]|nr:IscS subfamily cysteine desulfurase [Pseudohongiellaceae bacterium]
MQLPIYLDYAATTPVDTRVAAKMSECLTIEGNFGNPASRSHLIGWQAEEACEIARRQVADLVCCDPREIVWTSGATESDNLAIKGAAQANPEKGRHIITSAIEHKAVLDTCTALEEQGFEVTRLRPDEQGVISAESVAAALRPDTVVVSIMHVNNEIGTVNDIAAIGQVCRDNGVLYHVDAAQSAGKIPIDLSSLPVDLMSFSAHKIYGPKGVGALYVSRSPRAVIAAQMHGGGHERGMRSGTLATHQLVGMGEAFALAQESIANDSKHIKGLRDQFLAGLLRQDGVSLNGHPEKTVPGIVNLAFADVDGESLLLSLREIAVSSGSACTSASMEPSYVLRSMGLADELAQSSLRFSFGRYTTEADIAKAIDTVSAALKGLRRVNVA